MKKQIIIAITGATGIIYAVRLLEQLKLNENVITHLIISKAAKLTLHYETEYSVDYIQSLADVTYDVNDIAASISSGSFLTDAMVILPCSVKTLSAIANCYDNDLIVRAADVILKERRHLILCFRETPLHVGHLKIMLQASEMGAQIMPLLPAFYHNPQTLDDIIDHSVMRICDQLGVPNNIAQRWNGINSSKTK